jgi:precorrin-3B synthase
MTLRHQPAAWPGSEREPSCSPPPCGGVGEAAGREASAAMPRDPPPRPSPTRGEGEGDAARNDEEHANAFSQRRGACPGLSVPMATGDGLLVRFIPSAPIPLAAFATFCVAARQHGNGTLEVTARGSLQVRGLTAQSAPLFASAVAALGIEAAEVVPVIASPLADDPDALINADALAVDLRRALARAQLALAPKVSVVVDDGGRLHLDTLAADIRLRAVPSEPRRLLVGMGGNGASTAWLGTIAPERAPDTVVPIMKAIAAHGGAARAIDVLRRGTGAFAATAEYLGEAAAPPPRPPAEPLGLHPLRDGRFALGVAPAFGQAKVETLAELARIAAEQGADSVRPAPGRVLLFERVAAAQSNALADAAENLGFVTRPDDPRRRIAACPGAPACASGAIAARALAAALVPTLAPQLARGSLSRVDRIAIHISGCAKGCAHPAPALLTLVGTARGCGIICNGTARAVPIQYVDLAELADAATEIIAGEARHD